MKTTAEEIINFGDHEKTLSDFTGLTNHVKAKHKDEDNQETKC